MSNLFVTRSATTAVARSRFLLEVALDRERLKTHIAEQLRAHRGAGDPLPRYTQPEMVERLNDRLPNRRKGISLRSYQRWEAAERLPGWEILEAIADEVGVSLAELLGEVEEPEPKKAESRDRTVEALSRRLEELFDEVAGLREDLARRGGDATDAPRQSPRRRS